MAAGMIFDVDGTLVDSVDLHARAWRDAFAHYGFQFEEKSIREQIGKGGDQLLPVFLSPSDIERIGKEMEEFRGKLFRDTYMEQVKPFAHVRTLIQRLLNDGVKVALASSAKQSELDDYKKIAGIDDLIKTETTSDDAEKSKPHPDIFAAAMERLEGIDPADVLVIGDTPYDAEAAIKAGLEPVGFLCGGWTEDALRGAGCTSIYRDPEAFLEAYAAGARAGERA